LVFDIPSVMVFPANIRSEGFKYTGPMDQNRFAAFAVDQMENFVTLIREKNYKDFINSEPDKNKILVFTAKKSTPPLLMALSKDLKGKLLFGEIRQSEEQMIKNFGITNFPTLMALTDGDNFKGILYEG